MYTVGSPFIIIDEITDGITSAKTEILNKIELLSTSVNNTYSSVLNVNTANLVNNLLSDSDNANKWALRQTGIGAALNSAFDLNNPTLAGLSTASAIAANKSVLCSLYFDDTMKTLCSKNPTINSAFNSLTAETILADGYGYKKYNVGDTVTLKYNGADTTFRVVHKNYKTANKIVLMSENILEDKQWHSSSANNYSSSSIRTYLNSTVLGRFSSAIQNTIVTTSVACHDKSTAVTCKDKIWLPSYTEVGLGTNTYAPVEGSCFSYFSTDATNRRIKNSNYWWLRTPYSSDSTIAWRVNTGGSGNYYSVTSSLGVVPAFEI